jgi:hypothetical protein
MDASALVVAVGHLVFFLSCAVLGVRLLAMARSTGQAPELFVGLALTGLTLPTPLMAAGGFGRGTVAELSWPIVALAFAALLAATLFLFAFTWKTFRPDAGWAKALVLGGALSQAFVLTGAFLALRAADPGTTADIVTAPVVSLPKGTSAAPPGTPRGTSSRGPGAARSSRSPCRRLDAGSDALRAGRPTSRPCGSQPAI